MIWLSITAFVTPYSQFHQHFFGKKIQSQTASVKAAQNIFAKKLLLKCYLNFYLD